jgi:phage/plasmid-associated DNA primase
MNSVLSNPHYRIYNLGGDDGKVAVKADGYGLTGFPRLTAQDLSYKCDRTNGKTGIITGRQDDGTWLMVLDFDCCGKKDKDGKRIKCDYTQQKLIEYRQFRERDDGFYASSTEGNYGILIDITRCEPVQRLFPQDKGSASAESLEVFWNDKGVGLPPCPSQCKMTGRFRPRQWEAENPILVLTQDDKWMIDYIQRIMEYKIEPERPERPVSPPPELTGDKWSDLLLLIPNDKIGGDYRIPILKWRWILGIAKLNGIPMGVVQKWCCHTTPQDFKMEWNSARVKNAKLGHIGNLCNIAKNLNLNGYIEWRQKYNAYIPLSTLNEGVLDVATYLVPYLLDVKWDGEWFYADKGIWKQSKTPPLAKIIALLSDQISAGIMSIEGQRQRGTLEEEKAKQITKDYLGHRFAIQSSTFSKQLATYLKDLLREDKFQYELNQNPYTLPFSNGIYDIRTRSFKEGIHSEDLISYTLPYPYEPPQSTLVAEVREEIKKICNYNDAHTEYYLSVLGYALTGDSAKIQEIWNLVGQTASNGKSTILSALTKILCPFVKLADSSAFEEGNKKQHKEVASWSGVRILWANETTSKKMDTHFLKKIADGESIVYDKLYSTSTEMAINFKLLMVSNHTMSFDSDAGIARRFQMIQHNSQFKECEDNTTLLKFKADTSFSEKLTTTYKFALIHLLLDYASRFAETKRLAPYPDEWKLERDEALEENNGFKFWFENTFEIGPDFDCSKKDWMETISEGAKGGFIKHNLKAKDELKKMAIVPYNYDSQMCKNGTKGFYKGFKLRTQTICDPRPDNT